ncbi:MAG: phosphatidylglycerophosphatase A [Planctomycetia bacterium]
MGSSLDTMTPGDSGPPAWRDPAVVAATCGGIGRMPCAPGTFGAALGVAVTLILGRLGLPFAAEAAVVVAINVIGVPICTAAARRLGRGTDPGAIVYDEMASVPLGLLVVPVAARTALPDSLPLLVAAFALHRLFDITKPFPCRRLEHLPAGLGIMADDWGATAWMAVALAACRWCGWL